MTDTHGAPDSPVPIAARRPLAATLREIAKKVRKINTHFTADPEKRLIYKDEIAAALEKLAFMLEDQP